MAPALHPASLNISSTASSPRATSLDRDACFGGSRVSSPHGASTSPSFARPRQGNASDDSEDVVCVPAASEAPESVDPDLVETGGTEAKSDGQAHGPVQALASPSSSLTVPTALSDRPARDSVSESPVRKNVSICKKPAELASYACRQPGEDAESEKPAMPFDSTLADHMPSSQEPAEGSALEPWDGSRRSVTMVEELGTASAPDSKAPRGRRKSVSISEEMPECTKLELHQSGQDEESGNSSDAIPSLELKGSNNDYYSECSVGTGCFDVDKCVSCSTLAFHTRSTHRRAAQPR